MSSVSIADYRLNNQRIAGQGFDQPEDVVRWMGALQAQDYAQAVWALGLRMRSGTLAAVEQALDEGRILRTWPMRGTVHFVTPQDARWMLKLTAARVIAADARRLHQLELTVAIMERCHDLFRQALQGRRRLPRPAMLQLLEEAGISTASQRSYHILWYAAQSGVIFIGPMQGKQQTFGLLEEWTPATPQPAPEEALAELCRRYFTSHGPATVHDFAWWGGLTLTQARRGLADARPHLSSLRVAEREYWLAADAPPPAPEPQAAWLLPGFDEYLLGYRDRSAVLAPEHAGRVVPGGNGVFYPTVVVSGQNVGVWKRAQRRHGLSLTISPFTPVPGLEERIAPATEAYAHFVGQPVTAAVQLPIL
jgi:hypothetical protein